MFCGNITRLAVGAAVLGAVISCGCSGKPVFPRSAVRGKVTIGGQPLADGMVQFVPLDGKGFPVMAKVTHGEYALSAKDGPICGENIVQIDSSPVLPGMAIDDESAYAKMITDGGGAPPSNPVPPQYRNRSPLRKVIEPAVENVADFPLEGYVLNPSPESGY